MTIAEFLEANANKKVSTITDELLQLINAQRLQASANKKQCYHKDADGNVVAIFCYYHKRWELVEHVPYGAKASTAHGLNTMCKEGTSHWTKQNRVYKETKAALLDRVVDGTLAPEDVKAEQEKAEAAKVAIVPHTDEEHSFDTLEEALEYNS